ncbi:Vesicle transport protein [Entamoeba marina]
MWFRPLVKNRLIGFMIATGVGAAILVLTVILFPFLGGNAGVYFFMIFYVIGYIALFVGPFFLYAPIPMLYKLKHPFRIMAIVLILICVFVVLLTSILLREDAIMFVVFGTIGGISSFVFFGFSLFPCFDKLLGSCCGGFFSTD